MEKTEAGALKEVVGTASADISAALSTLASKRVEFAPPTITVASIGELPELVGGPKKLVVGTYAPIYGQMQGNVSMILPIQSALLLADVLRKKDPGSTKALLEEDRGAIMEASNMLFGTYLIPLGKLFNIASLYGIPRMVSTFGDSVADFALLGLGKEIKHVLLLRTNFTVPGTDIRGDFILLLAAKAIEERLEGIKREVG